MSAAILIACASTALAQTGRKPKTPPKKKPEPAGKPAPITRAIEIKGPIKVQFRQDTDAYFVITTSRKILVPATNVKAALDSSGFVPIGNDIIRSVRRGQVWKASSEGYQPIPGHVPVLTRINFFTQWFGRGDQSVVGALVRTDGSLVNQEISNYTVQSGYETLPFPWRNMDGSTTWMPFDRPTYESKTAVINRLGAPIVPDMPFPMPSSFESDTRFSVLLSHPDLNEGIQTVFRTAKLHKSGEDTFATGSLQSANDTGPQVSGTMTVNLSLGTLHSLDSITKLPSGVYSEVPIGPWEFRIQAQRVAASKYQEIGMAEFSRVASTTSTSTEFNNMFVTAHLTSNHPLSLIGKPGSASMPADSKVTLLSSNQFEITAGESVFMGSWRLAGRLVELSAPNSKPMVCSINLKTRELMHDGGLSQGDAEQFFKAAVFPMTDKQIKEFIMNYWRMGLNSDMPVEHVTIRSKERGTSPGTYRVTVVARWTGMITGRNDTLVNATIVKRNGEWIVQR